MQGRKSLKLRIVGTSGRSPESDIDFHRNGSSDDGLAFPICLLSFCKTSLLPKSHPSDVQVLAFDEVFNTRFLMKKSFTHLNVQKCGVSKQKNIQVVAESSL